MADESKKLPVVIEPEEEEGGGAVGDADGPNLSVEGYFVSNETYHQILQYATKGQMGEVKKKAKKSGKTYVVDDAADVENKVDLDVSEQFEDDVKQDRGPRGGR